MNVNYQMSVTSVNWPDFTVQQNIKAQNAGCPMLTLRVSGNALRNEEQPSRSETWLKGWAGVSERTKVPFGV